MSSLPLPTGKLPLEEKRRGARESGGTGADIQALKKKTGGSKKQHPRKLLTKRSQMARSQTGDKGKTKTVTLKNSGLENNEVGSRPDKNEKGTA